LRKRPLGATRSGLFLNAANSLEFFHGKAANRPPDCPFQVANSRAVGGEHGLSGPRPTERKREIMKKLLIAAGAASLLALSSLAAVADEAQGSITSVDPTTMTVTLDDGNTYALPASVDAASLQIGEKVKIEYSKDANGKMNATAVTPSAS
jgi:hypothetical protein